MVVEERDLRKALEEFASTYPAKGFLDNALFRRGGVSWLFGTEPPKAPWGDEEGLRRFLRGLSLVPGDADVVLLRLQRGEVKQFCDSYIEANTCSYLDTLCREEGPRIYYLINTGHRSFIEIYSECVRLDMLMALLLGDLALFTLFEKGWRGGVPYVRVGVPRTLLTPRFVKAVARELEERRLEDLKRGRRPVRLRSVDEVRSYVESLEGLSEVIVTVPCPNEASVEFVSSLLEAGRRAYAKLVVARPPGEAEIVCGVPSDKLVASYLVLIEAAEGMGAYVCTSDVVDTHVVLNRSTVITVARGGLFKRESVLAVDDRDYAERMAQVHYRACLCTNNLVRGRGVWSLGATTR